MIDRTLLVCYFIHMKTRTNVSIDKNIFEASKAHNIVLSKLLENAVRAEIARLEEETWREDNRDAIGSYNKYIKENGVFSEELRTF